MKDRIIYITDDGLRGGFYKRCNAEHRGATSYTRTDTIPKLDPIVFEPCPELPAHIEMSRQEMAFELLKISYASGDRHKSFKQRELAINAVAATNKFIAQLKVSE